MKKRLLLMTVVVLVLALTMNLGVGFAATKKSIYVVSSMTVKTTTSGYSNTEKITFKYTKNGLLKSYEGDNYTSGSFKYDGKKLKSSEIVRGDGVPSKCKYTWKNGKLTKSRDSNNYTTVKYKYNKKGLITKLTATSDYSTNPVYEMTYTYNKKKHVTKEHIGVTDYKYTYNSKGRLTKYTQGSTVYTFKNTVKNSRVTKIVKKIKGNSDYKVTITIKYKKLSVPSTYVKLIKKQRNYVLMDQGYNVRAYNFPLGAQF